MVLCSILSGSSLDSSPRQSSLKPEQIRDFHEELPAIVDVAVAGAQQIAVDIKAQWQGQVLQVAVVADVDRGIGVHQVGNEEIGIELLACRQRGEALVGQ